MAINPDFPNVKGFKMGMLNIVSLPKHIEGEQCLDILALNERRLDDSIFLIRPVFVQNYDLIRMALKRGGGVCLYEKNSINYLERKDLRIINLLLHRSLLERFIDRQVPLSSVKEKNLKSSLLISIPHKRPFVAGLKQFA